MDIPTRPKVECFRSVVDWCSLGPIDPDTKSQIVVALQSNNLKILVVNLRLINRFMSESPAIVFEDIRSVPFIVESTRLMRGSKGIGTDNPKIFKAAVYSAIAAHLWNHASGTTVNQHFVQTLTNAHRACMCSIAYDDSDTLNDVRNKGLCDAIRLMLAFMQYHVRPHPPREMRVSKLDELAGLLYLILDLTFTIQTYAVSTWSRFIATVRASVRRELLIISGVIISKAMRYPCTNLVDSMDDNTVGRLIKKHALGTPHMECGMDDLRARLKRASKHIDFLDTDVKLSAKFMWEAQALLVASKKSGDVRMNNGGDLNKLLEDITMNLDNYSYCLGSDPGRGFIEIIDSKETARYNMTAASMIEKLVADESLNEMEDKILALGPSIDVSSAFAE